MGTVCSHVDRFCLKLTYELIQDSLVVQTCQILCILKLSGGVYIEMDTAQPFITIFTRALREFMQLQKIRPDTFGQDY